MQECAQSATMVSLSLRYTDKRASSEWPLMFAKCGARCVCVCNQSELKRSLLRTPYQGCESASLNKEDETHRHYYGWITKWCTCALQCSCFSVYAVFFMH